MKLSNIDENFKPKNANEPDVEWHEISEGGFDLYGVYYSKKDQEYLRFSKEWAKSFNEYVYCHANRTTGGRVKFKTNSPYVAVRVIATFLDVTSEFSISGAMGTSLYADDYYSTSFSPDIDLIRNCKRGGEVVYDGIYKISKPHVPSGTHDVTLYFPILNGVKKIYVGIKKGSVIENGRKYKHRLPVLFYGSSITMGIAASRAGNDYVSTVCRMLDTDYINFGLAGQAKGQTEMANRIAQFKLSVFVVDYDYNAPSVQHLQDTHYGFYEIIRKENPTTPIVFMSQPNVDYCINTEERRAVIMDTYRRASLEGDKNVYFIDGETLFEGEARDGCTADGCHPNDLGFYRMAKAVYPLLASLLNK